MAYYNIRVGGTKTSGVSIHEDWSLANCYGSIQSAIVQPWTSNDVIVLYDETHNVSGYVMNFNLSAAAANQDMLMVSRSGDPALCRVIGDGADYLIRANHINAHNYEWRGIEFGLSAPMTGKSAAVFVQANSAAKNLTFRRVRFANASKIFAGSDPYGLFASSNANNRVWTFDDCDFAQLSNTSNGGTTFANTLAGEQWNFLNCRFADINVNVPGEYAHLGGIAGAGAINLTGCTADGITIASAAQTDLANYGFIAASGPLTVDGLDVTACAMSGAAAGAFLRAMGPYAVAHTRFRDCVSTPAPGINSVGGTFLAFGPNGQGTLHDHRVVNCVSDFGVGSYCSQGGGGILTQIDVASSTARVEGILYAGGWGDVTWDGFRVANCVMGQDVHGPEGWGGALYAHNHSNSTRDKTTTIRNGLIVGGRQMQADGDVGIRARGLHTTYAHNVVIENLVIDCPRNRSQIRLLEEGSMRILNVSGSGIYCVGGEDGVTSNKVGIGIFSYSTPQDVSALPVRRGVVIGGGTRRQYL